MDLTYWIALALAALVTFVVSFALALVGRDLSRSQHRRLFTFLVLADFVLLVDWTHIADAPRWVPLADVICFPIFTLIGISIGIAPSGLVLAIMRRLRR